MATPLEMPKLGSFYSGCFLLGPVLFFCNRDAMCCPHGMAFYGTEASLFVDRIGMELYPEPKPPAKGAMMSFSWEPRMEKIKVNEDKPTPLHTGHFVDCVRARKEPFANIEVGTRATIISCIGNVAYWTGRKLKWDAESRSFRGDEEANAHLFRTYRKPWDLVKFV